MDRTNTVYIYDGKDTWTDTNGVEWNQEVIQFCQFCQSFVRIKKQVAEQA